MEQSLPITGALFDSKKKAASKVSLECPPEYIEGDLITKNGFDNST